MTFLPRISRISLYGLAGVLLAACTDGAEKYEEHSVEILYNKAQDLLDQEQWGSAATAFDEVESQHPYSKWAGRSQIMAAYAHYMRSRYDDAIIVLDRFLQLHPSNDATPYAYYLKALCYYEQISNVARDQKMTELAMQSFKEIITRYPHSKYTRDAQIKFDLTHDLLAGKHMNIGRYYLRQGHYLAAINRFKIVIDEYQTTSHTPEALHRMVESYQALGLVEEARKTAAVLGYNYPNSDWYIDTYETVEETVVDKKEAIGPAWYEFWKKGKHTRKLPVERKPKTGDS